MSTIYLAGPIHGLTCAAANEWRRTATKLLAPHRCINPLTCEKPQQVMHDGNRQIFLKDRHHVLNQADIVLVNLLGARRVSIGTMMEIGWANAIDIPVVTAMDKGNIHDHAFVRNASIAVVGNLHEALNLVRSLT